MTANILSSPIITSLLDTDLYKLTMMQCVYHHFPTIEVKYCFQTRRELDLIRYKNSIEDQISKLCSLSFSEDELTYLASLPYFKQDFIDYLRGFKLDEKSIEITIKGNNTFGLIIRGLWVNTIMFEVPLLAIISEIYHHESASPEVIENGRERLKNKIAFVKQKIPNIRFSDFGTRRRFSRQWQAEVVKTLSEVLPTQLLGTSNIYFAKQLHIAPLGTMAHEYLQACQVLAPNIVGNQAFALNTWLKEYPDHLRIALTDVLTMDVFLHEFNKDLADRFAGIRQDSGDPIQWGDKALKHYEALGIDPKTKIFLFSDSLTMPLVEKIYHHFYDKCQPQFGIGTHLTNDLGIKPADVVIKMTYANHKPVVKICDSPGKTVSEDKEYLEYVKNLFKI